MHNLFSNICLIIGGLGAAIFLILWIGQPNLHPERMLASYSWIWFPSLLFIIIGVLSRE